jgi:hypothetical protein
MDGLRGIWKGGVAVTGSVVGLSALHLWEGDAGVKSLAGQSLAGVALLIEGGLLPSLRSHSESLYAAELEYIRNHHEY